MLITLMNPAQRIARLLVLGSWMALISYWSSQASLPIDQPTVANILHGFQHRFAHAVSFGLLALLARWALDGLPRAAMWSVVLASVFGATDEWHQSFTPGRHAGADDWAADTAFAAAAIYAWSRVRATPWRTPLRLAAPLAVAAMFVVGVSLAVWPALSLTRDFERPSLRNVPGQVAHTALDVARSTRDLARQFRSAAAG
jgi:VanZ family protein